MSHVIETATSGRARCRACRQVIPRDSLRLGQRAPNAYGEGESTFWFHLGCGAARVPEVFMEALSVAENPGPEAEKYRRVAELASAHRRLPRLGRIEVSPTGRARCRWCREPIAKGVRRMTLEVLENGMLDSWGYLHLGCVRNYTEGDVVPLLEARGDALDEETRWELSGAPQASG